VLSVVKIKEQKSHKGRRQRDPGGWTEQVNQGSTQPCATASTSF